MKKRIEFGRREVTISLHKIVNTVHDYDIGVGWSFMPSDDGKEPKFLLVDFAFLKHSLAIIHWKDPK